jgi:hypothetical protein
MKTLHEFLEAVSRRAEVVFKKRGMLRPMWHFVNDDGSHVLMPSPRTDKDTAAALVRSLLVMKPEIARYAFMDEAWSLAVVDPDEAEGKRVMAQVNDHGLQDHPDREEIVMFSCEDRGGGFLVARRQIIRPAGGKPRLGPLEIDDHPGAFEGRFIGMFPRGEAALQ